MAATPLLSVCIPTYNRLPKLRQLLAVLLPQLTPDCELVILDNASDTRVDTGIGDLLAGFATCPVRLIRHAANVGGNANILRCFEMAQGDWVWITGDDDIPVECAVACLLEESRLHREAVFINFASTILEINRTPRPRTVSAQGLAGFIGALDNFSNLLFISAGIYRRARVLGHLNRAYSFIDTCGPHTALLLLCLIKDGGETRFSHRLLVGWQATEAADQWDVQTVYRRLQRLLDLIPTVELRELWFAKVSAQAPPPLRTLPSLFKYVVSRKGNLDAVRDQLELSAYLGIMVPSRQWRARFFRFTAGAAALFWLPVYLAWRLVPAGRPGSLARYGEQPGFMEKFLEDKRV